MNAVWMTTAGISTSRLLLYLYFYIKTKKFWSYDSVRLRGHCFFNYRQTDVFKPERRTELFLFGSIFKLKILFIVIVSNELYQ